VTRIGVALFNYRDGGQQPNGPYDFQPLQHAFAQSGAVPALILFCEAKQYRDNGSRGLYGAAEALADELGHPYMGVLGTLRRGPLPPAIFFNPNVLVLRQWFDDRDPNAYEDTLNLAWFAVRDSAKTAEGRRMFGAWVQHWDPKGGFIRRAEAAMVDRYGLHELPIIGGGDLNGTASGPHWPQRDWMAAGYRARSHKGIRLSDPRSDGDVWQADTDAVDHLIGRWDADAGQRVDGCGYTAIAEMAWRTGMPREQAMAPTVNDGIDVGGGLLIDILLANRAMAPHVCAGTYRVHIPDPAVPDPSDHRLVTVDLDL
jgi:hypothetical protein